MTSDCAYADCVRQLGVEGQYLGRTAMSGGGFTAYGAPVPSTVDVFVWQNPAIGVTLQLSFRDGKLAAREVSGRNGVSGRSVGQR